MSNSTFSGAITTVQSTIQALNIQLNSASVPVVVRKLPIKQETVDPSTQIIVCPSDKPETYKRLAFGGHYEFSPLIQVVLISPNNGDEITNLTAYLDVRQQIATALSGLSLGLRSSIEFDTPIDRTKISENYDYLSLGYRVTLWT